MRRPAVERLEFGPVETFEREGDEDDVPRVEVEPSTIGLAIDPVTTA